MFEKPFPRSAPNSQTSTGQDMMNSEYPREIHGALAKDGWIGIARPEELGGSGLGISEATMMLQTISQSGAGIAGAQSIHANVYTTQPVAKFAKNDQRKNMLPRLISGEWKACSGVTEPRSGDRYVSMAGQ